MSKTRVYLHIGAPKTGTTFLQAVLLRNKKALRSDGLLVPGKARRGHVAEMLDLRQMHFKGYRNPATRGAWPRAVEQIRGWEGPVILDQELLSGATEEQIDRAFRDLDFAELHIVYTARDMARQVTAGWQEWIKNRESTTFADFLASVRDPENVEPRTGKLFWRLYDTPAVLARWTRGVPPEHVHVITVPPPGADPGLLWRRFSQVLGIDPARYDTEVGSANASLGAAEATVLRRVNVALGGDQFSWPMYDRLIKHGLAPMLGRRRGEKIELPKDVFDWAVDWSQRAAKYIDDAGFEVVGDLDEIVPRTRPVGRDPDHAPDDQQAEAAIEALAGVITDMSRGGVDVQRQIDDLRNRAAEAEAALSAYREAPPRERIRRTASELSSQVRWLGVLAAGYRRVRGTRPRSHT